MGTATELVDLVDRTGELRMRGVPRPEAASYPDLHMKIVIVVAFDALGRLLAQQRAEGKSVASEAYDHVCGAILSGEDPIAAGIREGRQETGVALRNLRQVHEGINVYGHWRALYLAEAVGEPKIIDRTETMWTDYLYPGELEQRLVAGQEFVKGYFEDMALALGHISISADHPFKGRFA